MRHNTPYGHQNKLGYETPVCTITNYDMRYRANLSKIKHHIPTSVNKKFTESLPYPKRPHIKLNLILQKVASECQKATDQVHRYADKKKSP